MSDFLPTLNSSGVFKFKKPIADTVGVQTVFTCKSIRKISELNSTGINVFQTYYASHNLTNAVYLADKAKDISIIGLYSDKASWLYVPSSQLDGYPNSSGVPYRRMGLAVELGPLEESYNLATVHTLVSDLIYSQLGIRPTVRTLSLSKASMVNSEDHDAIRNMRLGKIDVYKTVFVELAESKLELQKSRDKIAALEAFILEHQFGVVPEPEPDEPEENGP